MRLLVSVGSAAEAVAALDGAAHIIDAKEPSRGPLGAVDLPVLTAIRERVPPAHPFSIALGDFTSAKDIYASVAALPADLPLTFLKLGFAGARSASSVADLVTTAREAVSGRPAAPAAPKVIAVAYADADRVAAPDPWDVCEAARRGGAAGVMLDTACKDGGTILGLMPPSELGDWVSLAHLHELVAGVAGSLRLGDLETVAYAGADIVGVRGAACDGGRTGTVSARRVAELVASLLDVTPAPSGEMPEDSFEDEPR